MTVRDMTGSFGVKCGAWVGRSGVKRGWVIEIGLVAWAGIGKQINAGDSRRGFGYIVCLHLNFAVLNVKMNSKQNFWET